MTRPILEYAGNAQTKHLRKIATVMLRIFGGLYLVYAGVSLIGMISAGRSFILAFAGVVTAVTSIVYLRVNLHPGHTLRPQALYAFIATLLNLGLTLTCLGSTFMDIPEEAPDGLVRDFTIWLLAPSAILLAALAIILFVILRNAEGSPGQVTEGP